MTMSPPTIAALGTVLIGAGSVGWGIVAVRRDSRRLLPSVAILCGALLVALGAAALVAGSGFAPGVLRSVGLVVAILIGISYLVLTAFLLANGVVMVRRERRSLRHALSLLLGVAMALLPILVVVAVHLRGSGTVAEVATTWLAVVGVALFGYVALAFGAFLLGSLLNRGRRRGFVPRYLVVLGAGLRGRSVSPILARRLDRAVVEFRRRAGRPMLVVSGGRGPDEVCTEASAMTRYLLERHGIPRDRIVLEERARNTRENLVFSRELFDTADAPAVVVTSGYHVLRTAVLTRELRMRARVVGTRTQRHYLPSAYLREFAALVSVNLVVNAALMAIVLALCVGYVLLS